ncbi:MAG: undecaprenyl diphosphate synthase family protein, partial [Myxococcota bacterium]
EIVDAARRLARDAELGKIDPEGLDEKGFAAYLYAPDLPDPDLLIRTGAEQRVSNFLLWQIAYSEIHLSERMWPEFRRAEFEEAILDYQQRERRFGLTSEQVKGDEVEPHRVSDSVASLTLDVSEKLLNQKDSGE